MKTHQHRLPSVTYSHKWLLLSSCAMQILFSPCLVRGPVSPPLTFWFRPSDSLYCSHSSGLTVWEPERTQVLSLRWLLTGEEPHRLGTSTPLQPQPAGSLTPQLPGRSSLRVSALPAKLRTQAGHSPASTGTSLSDSLERSLQNLSPSCSTAGARMTRVPPVGALHCGRDQVAFM